MASSTALQKLVAEIRAMIWDYVLVEIEQRIITIDHSHPLGPDENLRSCIQEPVPAILHFCHESRQLALVKYGLAFPPSTAWSYSGSRKYSDLKKLCQAFGFLQKGTKDEII